jgi:hypothetical protein
LQSIAITFSRSNRNSDLVIVMRALFLLFSSFLVLSILGGLVFAEGIEPGTTKPEAVWNDCIRENTEAGVWQRKLNAEQAVASSYRACRLEFKSLLASLLSDDARLEYRAKVKARHAEQVATADEMIGEGDPSILGDDDPPTTSADQTPAKDAIATAEAELQQTPPNILEMPKPVLKHYDPNRQWAVENTLGCRWQDDLPKWFKLNGAGRRDLADQLQCVVIQKGTELLLIEGELQLSRAVPLAGTTATEFWFSNDFVRNALSQAIHEQCPNFTAYDPCSTAVYAQYTSEAE